MTAEKISQEARNPRGIRGSVAVLLIGGMLGYGLWGGISWPQWPLHAEAVAGTILGLLVMRGINRALAARIPLKYTLPLRLEITQFLQLSLDIVWLAIPALLLSPHPWGFAIYLAGALGMDLGAPIFSRWREARVQRDRRHTDGATIEPIGMRGQRFGLAMLWILDGLWWETRWIPHLVPGSPLFFSMGFVNAVWIYLGLYGVIPWFLGTSHPSDQAQSRWALVGAIEVLFTVAALAFWWQFRWVGLATVLAIQWVVARSLSQERLAVETSSRIEMEHLHATTDPLTNLGNRRRWTEIAPTVTEGGILAIADIDHFKQVNDTWGHEIGDVVLVAVARQLQEHRPAPTQVFRWGGEEFLLWIPGVPLGEALAVLSAYVEAIAAAPISIHSETSLPVTISLGGSWWEGPPTPWDPTVLVADTALYHAKTEGRNQARWEALPEAVPLD